MSRTSQGYPLRFTDSMSLALADLREAGALELQGDGLWARPGAARDDPAHLPATIYALERRGLARIHKRTVTPLPKLGKPPKVRPRRIIKP